MRSRNPFEQKFVDDEVENRKENDERYARRVRRAIEHVMSSKEGREAMEIILDFTRMHCTSFSTEPLTMAYNEGRRSVGILLTSLLSPDSYQLMLKEANERRNEQRRGRSDG